MRNIRFRVEPGSPTPGLPTYSREEYSFRFEPTSWDLINERVGADGPTSLLIGTLQLELAVDSGQVVFVWGYHPYMHWLTRPAQPRDARPGAVFAVDDEQFNMGVSVRIAEPGAWTTVYDEGSGWVRLSADLGVDDEQVILIADNTALGLVGDQLNSIWLHPAFDS